jgi:hypothetical protein
MSSEASISVEVETKPDCLELSELDSVPSEGTGREEKAGMVGLAGVEPATFGLGIQRSVLLSYRPEEREWGR